MKITKRIRLEFSFVDHQLFSKQLKEKQSNIRDFNCLKNIFKCFFVLSEKKQKNDGFTGEINLFAKHSRQTTTYEVVYPFSSFLWFLFGR